MSLSSYPAPARLRRNHGCGIGGGWTGKRNLGNDGGKRKQWDCRTESRQRDRKKEVDHFRHSRLICGFQFAVPDVMERKCVIGGGGRGSTKHAKDSHARNGVAGGVTPRRCLFSRQSQSPWPRNVVIDCSEGKSDKNTTRDLRPYHR